MNDTNLTEAMYIAQLQSQNIKQIAEVVMVLAFFVLAYFVVTSKQEEKA